MIGVGEILVMHMDTVADGILRCSAIIRRVVALYLARKFLFC